MNKEIKKLLVIIVICSLVNIISTITLGISSINYYNTHKNIPSDSSIEEMVEEYLNAK